MFSCVSCDRLHASSALMETVTIGDDTFRVCGVCVDGLSGPGKHEAVAESDRALCVVLEYLRGISMEDHFLTDESYGYLGVFDRFMLLEDDRGFVEVREFPDAQSAMREANRYEDDGFGASEWDAWITDDRGGYAVSFEGKYVGTYPRLNRARAAVSLLMRDSGYYPNVFLQNDHGNIRRVDVRYLEEVK